MWAAIGVLVAAAGIVCALTGLLLARVPMGKVTWVNRLAGPVLGGGVAVGGGKLLPGVLVSWARWTVVGAAVIYFWFHGWTGWGGRSAVSFGPVGKTLLALAWVVDGAALLYLIRLA